MSSGTLPIGWLRPEWALPPGVRAACSTRVGGPPGLEGASEGAYAAFNLGDHVGDLPRAVAANRAAAAKTLGAQPVFLRQVHGTRCATLEDGAPREADACVTTQARLACTIMVADCLPVLFAHEAGGAVAAAHAGWRGLAAGVLESAIGALAHAGGDRRITAWLGPCIGPTAFEVGDEVKAEFESSDRQAGAHFVPAHAPGKWFANLPALARQRLLAAGITRIAGNDGSPPWCTVGNPSRFFSHRRDRVSGRFAAFVWRD